MSTVVVGCDSNGVHDSEVQNTVAKALENAGHKVQKLTIGPGYFADYSYGNKGFRPRGKIGVYIIADGINSISDLAFGNTQFKYAYFIIRGDLGRPRMKTRNDFETRPIGADNDCKGNCAKLKGKTFPQMNKIVKNKCQIVFGRNAQEMADELIKAMGGETNSAKSSSKTKSSSSIKTALQEVLYGWNGEVECYLRDDTIHIHKVKDPTSAKLQLIEGVNVLFESISVTDINPKTVNHLIVKWGTYEFEIKDEARIERFGEVKKTITSPAKKKTSVISFAYREWQKLLKNSGRKLECHVDGNYNWRIGEWVRVYIPSFELDGYMYITKASHDDDGDWECGLTLEDYPPDLGTKPSQKVENKSNGSS